MHESTVLYGLIGTSAEAGASLRASDMWLWPGVAVLTVAGLALICRNLSRAKPVDLSESHQIPAAGSAAGRLLERVSDWVWETDPEHRFIRISEGIQDATGLAADRIYGQTLIDVHAGDAGNPNVDAHLARIRRHEPFRGFVYRQTVRGRARYFDVSGVPKFDADRRFDGYLGTGRDITEIIEARAETESIRQMLGDALDGVAAAISLWDANGLLVLGNRQFSETNADIPRFIVPGTHFEDFIRIRYRMSDVLPADASESDKQLLESLHATGERRLRHHGDADMTSEIDLPNGHRNMVRDSRTSDGSTVTVGVDITDQKNAEEKLRQSQEMMSSILDALPLSVTMVDENGRLTYVNRFEQERWGYDAARVIGEQLYDLLPAQVSEKAREEDRRVIETGRPLPFFEERIKVNGDESVMWIGKIPVSRPDDGVGVCMIGLDITDRVEAMDALQEISAGYRRTLELFPEAVYVSIDGKLAFANAEACNQFRAPSRDGLNGYPSLNLFHPSSHERVFEARRTMTAEADQVRYNRHRFVRLDGSEFDGETKLTSIIWDGKQALLVLLRDVTEELQRSQELETAKLEADRANVAKSEFLASMSHEIRTPLNGVLGMTNLLMDSSLTFEQRKQVETVRTSGNLLLSLLNDILDLSKIEAGRLELETIDFDLAALLVSVSDLWAPKAEAQGLRYSQLIEADVAPVLRSDPTRIRQILFNFMSNALKFTSAGEIAVCVRQARGGDGRISTRFEVRDTGEGIPPDKFSQLFQKFAQADTSITRKHGGTGLGLAISRELAEAMNGEVGVDSTLGEGSTFWFSIVCEPGETDNIVDDFDLEDASAPVRRLRILVAEDNDVNQLVVRAMLEKAGHRVDVVGNGLEAVSAVMDRPFDVVLMDVQMPEMDGVTATRRIRSLAGPEKDVPVIALTANAMKGDREKYLAAGMDDYVSKPVDPHLLNAALQRHHASRIGGALSLPVAGLPDEPAPTGAADDLSDLFRRMDAD